MATTKRAPEDHDESVDNSTDSVKVSKEREAFNNGELTWRELCEAENKS